MQPARITVSSTQRSTQTTRPEFGFSSNFGKRNVPFSNFGKRNVPEDVLLFTKHLDYVTSSLVKRSGNFLPLLEKHSGFNVQ